MICSFLFSSRFTSAQPTNVNWIRDLLPIRILNEIFWLWLLTTSYNLQNNINFTTKSIILMRIACLYGQMDNGVFNWRNGKSLELWFKRLLKPHPVNIKYFCCLFLNKEDIRKQLQLAKMNGFWENCKNMKFHSFACFDSP